MAGILDGPMAEKLTSLFRNRVGWQSVVPTLYQGGVVASTPIDSWYYADDGKAHVIAGVTAAAVGAAANTIYIRLPLFLTPNHVTGSFIPTLGTMVILDTGTAWFHGACAYAGLVGGLPAFMGIIHGSGGGAFGVTPAQTLAIGDRVGISVTYRLT